MDTDLVSWPCPAKLNLFLHITGRRADGYHELQTLFQLLDYGDRMTFAVNDTGEITLDANCDIPLGENIVYRAARLLQETASTSQGCHIRLRKVLPMGGGLGGGSSNAATTLLALNHYWRLQLPSLKLQQLGLQLGADVPVFVNGQTAFATGIGEKLTATAVAPTYYLVVKPALHVTTADIFKHPELPRTTRSIAHADYSFENTRNDCQRLVCDHYPDIANTLRRLLEYAPTRLTGTGACLFSCFDERQQAQQVAAQLPAQWQWFIAAGVNESPALALVKNSDNGVG